MTRSHPDAPARIGRLAVAWSGDPDAPTVVLLHGVTNSAAGWVDAVARWSGRYRLAAFDALGHGGSERFTDAELADGGEGAVEALVTTTIAALETVVAASSPAVLYGHSMGGAMASVVAVRRPDLVRALLLEDPAWRIETAEVQRSRAADWLALIDEQTRDPEAAIAEALAEPEPTWPRSEIRPWVTARAQVDTRFIARSRPEMAEPWQEQVPALGVPTLLVTGSVQDEVIVDAGMRRAIAAVGNPLIETAVVEGAGHSVRRDRTDAFHAVVDPWIASRFA